MVVSTAWFSMLGINPVFIHKAWHQKRTGEIVIKSTSRCRYELPIQAYHKLGKKHYGGFRTRMNYREAAAILGVR